MVLTGGHVAHDNRHAQKAGDFRGAPAAFSRDDLKAIADAAHDNRLDDAVGLDRLREFLKARIVDVIARLKVTRRETINVGLDRRRADGFRGVRDERAKTFAERGAFFHIGYRLKQPRRRETTKESI